MTRKTFSRIKNCLGAAGVGMPVSDRDPRKAERPAAGR